MPAGVLVFAEDGTLTQTMKPRKLAIVKKYGPLKRARQATGTRKRLLVIEAGGYTVTRGYSEIEVAARPIHAGPAARIEGCTTAGARRAASWQAEIAPSQAEGHTSVFHMLQCPRHA
eukprot:scaffold39334_cov18-Tisochrysis_lutea.AAC.2